MTARPTISPSWASAPTTRGLGRIPLPNRPSPWLMPPARISSCRYIIKHFALAWNLSASQSNASPAHSPNRQNGSRCVRSARPLFCHANMRDPYSSRNPKPKTQAQEGKIELAAECAARPDKKRSKNCQSAFGDCELGIAWNLDFDDWDFREPATRN